MTRPAPPCEWLLLYKEPDVLFGYIISSLENLNDLGRLLEAAAGYGRDGLQELNDATLNMRVALEPQGARPVADFLVRNFSYTRRVECKINSTKNFCEIMESACGDVQLQILEFMERLDRLVHRMEKAEKSLNEQLEPYFDVLEKFKETVWAGDRTSAKSRNIEGAKKAGEKFSHAKQAYSDAHDRAASDFSEFNREYKDCLKELQTLCERVAYYAHMVAERTAAIEAMFRLEQAQTAYVYKAILHPKGETRPFQQRDAQFVIENAIDRLGYPPCFPGMLSEDEIRKEEPLSTSQRLQRSAGQLMKRPKDSIARIFQFEVKVSKENQKWMEKLEKSAVGYRLKGTGTEVKSGFRLGIVGDNGLFAFEGYMMTDSKFKPATDGTLWRQSHQQVLKRYRAVYILSEGPAGLMAKAPRSIKTAPNTWLPDKSADKLKDGDIACEVMTSKGVVKDVPKKRICFVSRSITGIWKPISRLYEGGLRGTRDDVVAVLVKTCEEEENQEDETSERIQQWVTDVADATGGTPETMKGVVPDTWIEPNDGGLMGHETADSEGQADFPRTSRLSRRHEQSESNASGPIGCDEIPLAVAPVPRGRKLGVSSPTDVKNPCFDGVTGFQSTTGYRDMTHGTANDGRGSRDRKHSPTRRTKEAPGSDAARRVRRSSDASPSAERPNKGNTRDRPDKSRKSAHSGRKPENPSSNGRKQNRGPEDQRRKPSAANSR